MTNFVQDLTRDPTAPQINWPRARIAPPLDPGFAPAVLARRWMEAEAKATHGPYAKLALEQADGTVSHFGFHLLSPEHPQAAARNSSYVERIAKFLLWARGGHKLYYAGPPSIGEDLKAHYQNTETGRFDADVMGNRIYEKPFEVEINCPLPLEHQSSKPLGRNLDGCRIGFDLGGSDKKVAALQDGKCVFSEEIIWSPVTQTDPNWHFDQIMDLLKLAASKLPRVDAIGGSAAGVYVNNYVKIASLFRGVSAEDFSKRIKPLFYDLRQAWNGIPFEVANDGEVTALAGSMSLGVNGVLGVAMGTSMAGGYVNAAGNITSWLNELAFVPVDYRHDAPVDEWSKDKGCGVQYFSQQAVGRLLEPAGLAEESHHCSGLAEKLVFVQNRMAAGDERAARIYQTIGVYLGYALAHFHSFYDFSHLLVLGRVVTGQGGEIILAKAREVLAEEFPEIKIEFHQPGEKEKRHGQAIAAASLPVIDAKMSS